MERGAGPLACDHVDVEGTHLFRTQCRLATALSTRRGWVGDAFDRVAEEDREDLEPIQPWLDLDEGGSLHNLPRRRDRSIDADQAGSMDRLEETRLSTGRPSECHDDKAERPRRRGRRGPATGKQHCEENV
jgi:hypothetical protein